MRAPFRPSRRQFLAGLGAFVAGLVSGCGRRQEGRASRPQPTSAPPTSPAAPTHTRIAVATFPPPPADQVADTVLLNGKVITVDSGDRIAQAVAIKDGLIQAVGESDQIRALAGEKTQVIDLAGKAATPGLIDAHNHLHVVAQMGGFYKAFLPPEVRTIADMQATLAELAGQTPKGEWILGYYLVFAEGRPPNRSDLDAAAPDHPVFLMQQGGHIAGANSAALRVAGVSAATANPVGGIIERDASGEPTGVLYNHRAMDVVRSHMPKYSLEQMRQGIINTQPLFATCGVTSFHDNNVRGVDGVGTYLACGKEGQMLLRGAVYYTLEWPGDAQRALQEVERYDNPYMRMAGFKFLIDGQAPTAYCHQPHSGTSWDMPTWDPAMFKQVVRQLHDTGLQISVHCAGDAATDLVLDAYEEAQNANPRPDPRHRIEHAVLTTPDATKRMRDLGVVVSTQPQFLRVAGAAWTSVFGAERAPRFIVTREWLDNGVALALGSDAPTTPWYTPQMTLAGAVARLDIHDQVIGPEQCLTIQEALRAHTMGSAYAIHEEHIKGSIEVGKMADLAVWGEDPYSNLGHLVRIPIAMTMVGGKIVYSG